MDGPHGVAGAVLPQVVVLAGTPAGSAGGLGADALALGDVHRPGVHRHRVHAQPGALGLGAGQGEQAQVIPHPDLIGPELQQAAVGGVHIQLLRGAPGQPGKGQLLPMAGAGE